MVRIGREAAALAAFSTQQRLTALKRIIPKEKRKAAPRNGKSPGAFPQAHVLALMEAGTHVLWRWVIKGCDAAETSVAARLMKHLCPGMLLLWDRGFAGFGMVKLAHARGAQLLARWKKNRILVPVKKLCDGSFLTHIYNSDKDRKAGKNGILVRIIEYTLEEPGRTGHREKHRLLTTLLDARLHPAKTLVELYHVRWEEEIYQPYCLQSKCSYELPFHRLGTVRSAA